MIPRRLAPSLIALPLLSALALPGCYGNPESFAKKAAKLYCERYEVCYRANFDDQYDGDVAECRDDVFDHVTDYDELQSDNGCEYDRDRGQRCIKTMRDIRDDCSDNADERFYEDCLGNLLGALTLTPAEVYTCAGGLSLEPVDDAPGALASPEPASFPPQAEPTAEPVEGATAELPTP